MDWGVYLEIFGLIICCYVNIFSNSWKAQESNNVICPIRCLCSCHINSKQRNSRGTSVFLSKKLLFISRNRAEALISQSWLTAQTLPLSLKCKSTWCDCWKIFQIKCFPSYLHPNLYSKWFVNKATTQRETAKDSNCLNYFKWYISGLLKCSIFCSCVNTLFW